MGRISSFEFRSALLLEMIKRRKCSKIFSLMVNDLWRQKEVGEVGEMPDSPRQHCVLPDGRRKVKKESSVLFGSN